MLSPGSWSDGFDNLDRGMSNFQWLVFVFMMFNFYGVYIDQNEFIKSLNFFVNLGVKSAKLVKKIFHHHPEAFAKYLSSTVTSIFSNLGKVLSILFIWHVGAKIRLR